MPTLSLTLRTSFAILSEDLLAKKMIDLYVMDVGKKLIQRPLNKKYITKKEKVTVLDILNHLQGKQTIGVFSGRRLSKFMTFDVDSGRYGMDKAKQMTWLLVSILKKGFFIREDQILISFSGHKGYHIDIFFNKAIEKKVINHFYTSVLKVMNDTHSVTKKDIELRPTGQGVKLPMGIHKGTGKRAYLCNKMLNRVQNKHLLDVQKVSVGYWLDKFMNTYPMSKPTAEALTMDSDKAQDLERLVDGVKTNSKTVSQQMLEAADILKLGHIKYKGTRDQSVLKMAIFLNSQGVNEQDAIYQIGELIKNSFINYRKLFSAKDDLSFVLSEVKRVTHTAYVNDYKFTGYKITSTVYKPEIMQILNIRSRAERKITLAMLIHSKIYANSNGEFFMTYKQISELSGTTTTGGRLVKYINHLADQGIIEIISRNVTDKIASFEQKRTVKKANVYRMLINSDQIGPSITISSEGINKDSLVSIVIKLIDKKECKAIVKKHEFYDTWRPAYLAG